MIPSTNDFYEGMCFVIVRAEKEDKKDGFIEAIEQLKKVKKHLA